MNTPPKSAKPEVLVSVMDAIYHRRAVRDYNPRTIDQTVIRTLLDAAVRAPTAMHEEPWAFAVIQDKTLLNRLPAGATPPVPRKDPEIVTWK
jgi:nitroreductase